MLTVNKTEQEIYNELSQESIMEYYLGITPGQGLFTNPFRKDTNPGCSFWRNPETGTLYFKDWATGRAYNCISIIMERFNLIYSRALKKLNMDMENIKNQFPIESASYVTSKNVLIQAEAKKKFDTWDLQYWNTYGITQELLDKYNVSPIKFVYKDKELIWRGTKSNPIYCYYFPESHKIKLYRPLNPVKQYKWLSSCNASDVHGYEHYIKGKPKHKVLFITSSNKDAMVINSFGFPCIAPQAETVIIEQEVMEKLLRYYKYIYILMDADPAGWKINSKYKELYPNVFSITIPLHASTKDISDFRKRYGKYKTYKLLKKLLKESVRIRDNQIPF